MEIFWELRSVTKNPNSILTVGTFDGVHRGHLYIINELKKRAEKCKCITTLVTFHPHPQVVLKSPDKPTLKILTTIEEKLELLEKSGLNRVVIIHFTRKFAKTPAQEFVKSILHKTIGFREIVIGYDHAFGKDRQGNIETLQQLGAELNFKVDKLEPFVVDGMVVSSTLIRNLLLDGKVKLANKLLGRFYFLQGKVVKGEGRGQFLNFPTANIEIDSQDKLIPQDGVYTVLVTLEDGKKYQGMMNIGYRPTFNQQKLEHTLEVHIFDFNQSIYNKKIKIEFVDKIRDEKKFSSPDELINQLKQDKEKSLTILQQI